MSDQYNQHENFADKAEDYLDRHNVYELFGDLLKQLVIHKPQDPFPFLLSLLQQPQHTLKVLVRASPGVSLHSVMRGLLPQLNVVQINFQQILNEELASDSDLGKNLRSYQDKNLAIPDEAFANVIGSRVSRSDCLKHGWILEGFPNTKNQAFCMQQVGLLPTHFLYFSLPEELAIKRLSNSAKSPAQIIERAKKSFASISDYYSEVLHFIDGSQDESSLISSAMSTLTSAPPSSAPRRALRVLLLGPRGAGRATQSSRLCHKLGLVHVSVGSLLRAEGEKSQKMKESVLPFLSSGDLVPDHLLVPLVIRRLQQSDCRQNGWILDGFPRTQAQADALVAAQLLPHRVIVLNVADQIAIQRCSFRYYDDETGCFYHLRDNPPPPSIAHRLTMKVEDQEDNLTNNLSNFRANIDKIRSLYGDKVLNVEGTQTIEQINQQIEAFLLASLGRYLSQPQQ